MEIRNKSNAWGGKPTVNITRITGYIIAKGGIRFTAGRRGNMLSDDYIDSLRSLNRVALLNNKTGMRIEELYEEALREGIVLPHPDTYPDPAAYILDLISQEHKRPYFQEEEYAYNL